MQEAKTIILSIRRKLREKGNINIITSRINDNGYEIIEDMNVDFTDFRKKIRNWTKMSRATHSSPAGARVVTSFFPLNLQQMYTEGNSIRREKSLNYQCGIRHFLFFSNNFWSKKTKTSCTNSNKFNYTTTIYDFKISRFTDKIVFFFFVE